MAKTKPKPYKQVEKIEVYLWGALVGMAAFDPSLGYYAFAYDKTFAKSGIEIAPLHMPLNEEVYIFTDLPTATYKRLPAALADALPDDFGNALINRYLADNGIAQDQITPLDRLAYMGNRAMGALEFKPAHGPKNIKPSAIEMNSLVLEARKAVKGNIAHDYHTDAALRSIIEVGTSAGGARAKAVIAWNPKTHAIQSGQVDAEAGFEHWLLKFDGMGRDRELGMSEHYGRIEYAYYLMATAAGIQMSESRLLEENGRAHFMTKRFDREGQHEKHHIQTLCAMNHLDYKKKSTNSYEQLFITLNQLNLSHHAYTEVFKRMLFNVMGRNCDDHTKNVSFLLKHGGDWELSPAYDITFAHNPQGEWTNQHLMSINGKFKNINTDDLMKIASQFDISGVKNIINDVRDAIQRWPTFAKKAGLLKEEIKRIQSLLILL
jgi:serine/threonine-protein kinase HipA